MNCNHDIVSALIQTQFPQWKDLPIKPVKNSGWDNHTFHLGDDMLVRLPSAAAYAPQVEKEQQWLPILASQLPLEIPKPVAQGKPTNAFPWAWSVYQWIEGESLSHTENLDLCDIAKPLARFLQALHKIDSAGGPVPSQGNFFRGGSLATYDAETRQAIAVLKNKIDADAATKLWESALSTQWTYNPVWVHGDVSSGNLLIKDGCLSAVIDFGLCAVGDPACDLVIAWTLFEGESREIFCKNLNLDAETWARARAWALWKALIIAAGLTETNAAEAAKASYIIDVVLKDDGYHP